MRTLLGDLMPLVLGGMLAWTGATKLFVRSVPRPAAHLAQPSDPDDSTAATPLLTRAVAWIELALGLTLLEFPTSSRPATATVLLTLGYLGYLGYVRLTARGMDGAAQVRRAVTWRCFVRACLVVVGGILATHAASPWWMAVAMHPIAAFGLVALVAVVLVALSTDFDHLWLVPLRRAHGRVPRQSQDTPTRAASAAGRVTSPLELELSDSCDSS